jgi:general nucleoside transport system ATP-binding protein
VLARELGLAPGNIQLVIASQPTWGLDVGAIAYVHGQLRLACSLGAAVLLISDELDEIFTLADTVAVMFKGRLSDAKATHQWDRQSIGLAMSGVNQVYAA